MGLLSITSLAREACIHDPVLLWGIVIGNTLIFLAYTWIPVSLIRVMRSHTVPLPLLWMLGGAFVLCCGLTHIIGVLVIFRPYFGLETGLLLMTAAISLLSAWIIHQGVPAIRQHLAAYEALRARVRDLECDLARAVTGAELEGNA